MIPVCEKIIRKWAFWSVFLNRSLHALIDIRASVSLSSKFFNPAILTPALIIRYASFSVQKETPASATVWSKVIWWTTWVWDYFSLVAFPPSLSESVLSRCSESRTPFVRAALFNTFFASDSLPCFQFWQHGGRELIPERSASAATQEGRTKPVKWPYTPVNDAMISMPLQW